MGCQRNMKSVAVSLCIIFCCFAGTASARELTIFVDHWPPYNFKKDDKIVGICTELIEAALKEAGMPYRFLIYPFKRALLTVKRTPDTMLFTVARVPQRENMFKWIGPLHPRKVCLYRLKHRTDIRIRTVEDIKRYRTGVLLGGSVEQFFITRGFQKDDYMLVPHSEQLIKRLIKNRVDLIPGDPIDLAYQMKHLEYNFERLENVYLLSEKGGYYMIANKDTSDEIVVKLQKSLDRVLASGIKGQIIKRYVH